MKCELANAETTWTSRSSNGTGKYKMLKLLESIGQREGAIAEDEPSLQVLEQSTRPETLVKQIEKATGQSAAKS